jgi:DNA-binding CsgD family transcriptional regulator
MSEFRYHPEIEGLKVNENGSEILLNDQKIEIKVRKNGKNPFRFIYFKGNQIGLARLILECWGGMPPEPKLTAKHKNGDHANYHYQNLHWSGNGGNSKFPSKLTPKNKREILQKIEDGKGDSEIAKEYGVTRNTIFNLRKKEKK